MSRIEPDIKSPNRIHVQSQIILPSANITTKNQKSEVKVAPSKKALILDQKQILQKTKFKKDIVKMTAKQLREAEKLGYVENRNGNKVLSKAGMLHFLPILKQTSIRTPPSSAVKKKTISGESTSVQSISSTFKTIRRKFNPMSSVEVFNDDDTPLMSPTTSFMQSTTTLNENETIIIPDDKDLKHEYSKIVKEPIVTSKDVINVSSQDGQLMAISAETFGGPPNAYYLCTQGNDDFIPINDEPLYLDPNNQLVPIANTVIVSDSNQSQSEASTQSIILSTGDGQQIMLDQQTLLAIINSGDTPQIMTPDGQQITLPCNPKELLAALAVDQVDDSQSQPDIFTTALSNTEVLQHEQLLNEVVTLQPVKAHVSETNAILTQPPIMSTSEQPSKGDFKSVSEMLGKNLEDSLAEIGVVSSQHSVPTSLELPITVTNPAIATVAVAVSSGLSDVLSTPQQISVTNVDLPLITKITQAASDYEEPNSEAMKSNVQNSLESAEKIDSDALDHVIYKKQPEFAHCCFSTDDPFQSNSGKHCTTKVNDLQPQQSLDSLHSSDNNNEYEKDESKDVEPAIIPNDKYSASAN